MTHECQIEKELDEYAWKAQYRIRCRCHSGAWVTWQPGDAEFVCPSQVTHDTNNGED